MMAARFTSGCDYLNANLIANVQLSRPRCNIDGLPVRVLETTWPREPGNPRLPGVIVLEVKRRAFRDVFYFYSEKGLLISRVARIFKNGRNCETDMNLAVGRVDVTRSHGRHLINGTRVIRGATEIYPCCGSAIKWITEVVVGVGISASRDNAAQSVGRRRR